MGASASKPARGAARAATRRQYPHSPSPSTTSRQPPPARPSPAPSATAAQHQQYQRQAQSQSQPQQAQSPQGPTYHSKERPSSVKSEGNPPARPNLMASDEEEKPKLNTISKHPAIDLDGRDPDFAASLRSIGPVIPNPTFSNSSTFNQPRSRPSNPSSTTSTSKSTSTSPYKFTTKNPSQSQTTPPAPTPPSNNSGSPTSKPFAQTNPALLVIAARAQLAEEAEKELESFGKRSHAGRQFLDAVTIKQILAMRDREGVSSEDIERHFRLRKGVVGVLGDKGVVGEIR